MPSFFVHFLARALPGVPAYTDLFGTKATAGPQALQRPVLAKGALQGCICTEPRPDALIVQCAVARCSGSCRYKKTAVAAMRTFILAGCRHQVTPSLVERRRELVRIGYVQILQARLMARIPCACGSGYGFCCVAISRYRFAWWLRCSVFPFLVACCSVSGSALAAAVVSTGECRALMHARSGFSRNEVF